MLIVEDDLAGLAAGVWDAFLGLAIRAVPAPSVEFRGGITTSVSISGGWNGSVSLTMPAPLATVAAATMFAKAAADVTIDEIADAVGELANVIGGNVKGLVDDACTLSLPMVASGSDYVVSVPGTTLESQVHFTCEGHPLRVSVHARR